MFEVTVNGRLQSFDHYHKATDRLQKLSIQSPLFRGDGRGVLKPATGEASKVVLVHVTFWNGTLSVQGYNTGLLP
jgi:hypothetical protein